MTAVNSSTQSPTQVGNTVGTNTAAAEQQNTANSANQVSGNFSQFLTLLTTQLQNQDPTNPMDSNQFTQELVEFSGVEQQINSNQKLDSLVALGVSNGLSNSLGYVGLDINYASSEVNFDGATPVKITYALNSAAKTNEVQIVDESTGNIVYQQAGGLTTGQNSFSWDGSETNGGKAPAGTYQLKIGAFDADGNVVDSTAVVSGLVHGVETQGGVINLLVGNRAVPIANVLNAFQPGTSPDVSTATNSSTNGGAG